jgi:hypothetical protein
MLISPINIANVLPQDFLIDTDRHCERSEAIHDRRAKGWIASSWSLSSGRALHGPVGSSQ